MRSRRSSSALMLGDSGELVRVLCGRDPLYRDLLLAIFPSTDNEGTSGNDGGGIPGHVAGYSIGSRFDGPPMQTSTSFFAYTSTKAGSLVCNVDLGDASVGSPDCGM